MGFTLPKNFDSPYKATNPGNFWKRWHISLSTWLKDYLYIPLGGNRKGTFASYFVILLILMIIVFLANTLWVTVSVITLICILALTFIFSPSMRRGIVTNINLMKHHVTRRFVARGKLEFYDMGGLNASVFYPLSFGETEACINKRLLPGIVSVVIYPRFLLFPTHISNRMDMGGQSFYRYIFKYVVSFAFSKTDL